MVRLLLAVLAMFQAQVGQHRVDGPSGFPKFGRGGKQGAFAVGHRIAWLFRKLHSRRLGLRSCRQSQNFRARVGCNRKLRRQQHPDQHTADQSFERCGHSDHGGDKFTRR